MKEKYIYPETITENFDIANFHIKYCLSFIKKYLKGDILEVGAGCGSFTKDYIKSKNEITLTETDRKNFSDLKQIFKNNRNVKVSDKTIYDENGYFDTILYLHVLEHIQKRDETKFSFIVSTLSGGAPSYFFGALGFALGQCSLMSFLA